MTLEHELHLHARALRTLARALVGVEHADDVLQDTAVQALTTPPRTGPLGGWLATVVRRLASRQRRSERRRVVRERAVARDEALPAVDAELQTRETLQQVTAALLALPQPYQGMLLLRYWHDLSPTAIAAQRGEPVATVKSRLQRGLALLRARLERERGGEWRATFAGALGLEPLPSFGAGALVTGVVTMSMTWKLVGGAVAVIAAAWWCVDAAGARSQAGGASERAPRVAVATVDGDRDLDGGMPASAPTAARTVATPAAATPEPFDRARTAAAWGVTDLGPLDAQGKAAALASLTRQDAGTLQEARELDFIADPAQGWLLLTNHLKTEIVLRMLDEGRYLTVPPGTMPKNVPPDCDPLILLTGVPTGAGETRGVLFPVAIEPGTPFAWARANQIAARDASHDAGTIAVVAEFNALPLAERTRRVDDMAAAQDAIDQLMRAQARGEITRQQMFERAAPLTHRQPPQGTALDRAHKLLRRR